MLHAVLAGKIVALHSEDALTCAVFERLRYLPPPVLSAWLAEAAPCGGAPPLRVDGLPDLLFWPTWPDALRGAGTVQPDVVLLWSHHAIVVEAKLWSPKSLVPGVEDGRPADQLARQWVSAHPWCERQYGGRVTVDALVYATAHLTRPERDLEETLQALHKAERPVRLYWLSWAWLGPLLRAEAQRGSMVAADLYHYLQQAHVAPSAASVWCYGGDEGRNSYWRQLGAIPDLGWRYRREAQHHGGRVDDVTEPVGRVYDLRAGRACRRARTCGVTRCLHGGLRFRFYCIHWTPIPGTDEKQAQRSSFWT